VLKIEVEDDNGNEISEINAPIPLNIRIKMDEGMSRYRVKLIDDLGGIRGQYVGSTDQKILELHVPPIKLPRLGKIRILVEESAGDSNYSQQYSILIHYLEYISQTFSEDISESFREASDEDTEFLETDIKENDGNELEITSQNTNEEYKDDFSPRSLDSTQDIKELEIEGSPSGLVDIKPKNGLKSQHNEKETESNQLNLSDEEKEYLLQRQQFLEEDLISKDLPYQIDSKSKVTTIETEIHGLEEE